MQLPNPVSWPESDQRRHFAYLKAALSSVPHGIAVFDENLHLQLWNQAFLELHHLTSEQVSPGLPLTTVEALIRYKDSTPPLNTDRFEALSFERMTTQGHLLQEHREPLWIDGQLAGLLLTSTDITQNRDSEEREQLAQTVFDHTPIGILVTDPEQRIVSSNPAITEITGFEGYSLIGQPVMTLLADDSMGPLVHDHLDLRGLWQGELDIRRHETAPFKGGVKIRQIADSHTGKLSHHLWIVSDITERKQAEARMQYIAQHDALTGLPNRLALNTRLEQLLAEARRHQWRIAIMFLDLDRFKVINDTLGHQVGDCLLQEVSKRISSVLRETDFVARQGGDEFVVVLPAISTPADAAQVASKIINSLNVPIRLANTDLHTSPSIGISLFPADGDDSDSILKHADTAMYHAKAAGRNNYQFYAPEMNQQATERLDLERKLRRAIKDNQFSLCYQPQFNAKTRALTGFEALIRWQHPESGIISPDRFIPIAEETGLIVTIGEWVLNEACRTLSAWQSAGVPPLRIAVNVSARQLRRRDFCEMVAGALASTNLTPELLELEITESSVMENPQEAIAILQRLGDMGVTLAIDDFGTGYSSLSYLKLFPIDHLKIDRSFVRDIEHDLNDRAIALGTIALAHSLGLKVVAEGVETEDQLALLQSNQCDEVQGYLFSKPLTSEAAIAFLQQYQSKPATT